MKPLHSLSIVFISMTVGAALLGGGVYLGKRLDQICLGTDVNPIEGLAETVSKGGK